MVKSRIVVICFVLAVASLGACSSDDGNTVGVTAADFSLTLDESSAPAGEVTFEVKNDGTFVHEMVVFKLADASDVPTKPNGEADESKVPEADLLGEVEDIEPGSTKSLKLDLAAGDYVLLCNKVDGDKVHFKEGMHTNFTVTAA